MIHSKNGYFTSERAKKGKRCKKRLKCGSVNFFFFLRITIKRYSYRCWPCVSQNAERCTCIFVIAAFNFGIGNLFFKIHKQCLYKWNHRIFLKPKINSAQFLLSADIACIALLQVRITGENLAFRLNLNQEKLKLSLEALDGSFFILCCTLNQFSHWELSCCAFCFHTLRKRCCAQNKHFWITNFCAVNLLLGLFWSKHIHKGDFQLHAGLKKKKKPNKHGLFRVSGTAVALPLEKKFASFLENT